MELSRISKALAVAVLVAFAPLAGPAAQAGSYATAYDMSIFLNEPHPFDIAVQPAEPVRPAGSDSGADLGVMPAGDEFGDLEELDGLDDLIAASEPADVNDPLEPVNRFIFGFNQIVEDLILRPISYTYNAVMPDAGQTAVRNFFDNLSSPVVLANDILQGEPGRAWDTLRRMAINTTVGIGGLWDAAAYMGIEEHREDFGQTLAVWGVGEGPYLVLPILGPSNPRDAIGRFGVDMFLDPVGLYLTNTEQEEWQYARIGVNALTEYAAFVEELDALRETSIDYYAALRNLYRQRRNAEIENLEQPDAWSAETSAGE